MTRVTTGLAATIALLVAGCTGMTQTSSSAMAPTSSTGMSFFITSTGSGKGADFGGLAGADKLCQTLAAAAGAGAGDKTWHAYLSTQGPGAVNARDRIGKGPWRNAKGVVVANNLDELHGTINLGKQTSLTEKGDIVNGRGDTPNRHDILTGSRPDGTAFPGTDDMTCGNYTKSGDGGAVMLGHHDRNGTNPDPVANVSWNSSHKSAGCSDAKLASTGSGGLLYCFATN
jgi:hypothetical protein